MFKGIKERWERSTNSEKVGLGIVLGWFGAIGFFDAMTKESNIDVVSFKKKLRTRNELLAMEDAKRRMEAIDDQVMVDCIERKIERFKKIYGI